VRYPCLQFVGGPMWVVVCTTSLVFQMDEICVFFIFVILIDLIHLSWSCMEM
jgi:hypothetical protein